MTAALTREQLEAHWMPFTANRQFKASPRLIERAQGMHYWTTDGRRILDGVAGLWCVNAGHGREEITQALEDLRGVDCDLLTVTQYLRPSPTHHPIDRWVKPSEFVDIRKEALSIGFVGVMSGPLVRSSYRAGTLYRQAIESRAAAAGQ